MVDIAFSLLGVNPRVVERIDGIVAQTAGGQASRSEISYDINYGAMVAPGLMFKPFLEFISHPDQSSVAAPSGDNTHALFIGVLFEIDAARRLGLASLGR